MRRRTFLAGLGLVPWLPALGAARRQRLVVVHAWGGWDVTFALDPKPRAWVDGPYLDEDPVDLADRAEIETFESIPVLVDPRRRPAVTTFFEHHAHLTTVINGLQVGAVGHHDGIRRILSGSAQPGRADLPSVVGATHDRPLGAIDFAGAGSPGPFVARNARMGPRGQLRALIDPRVRYPAPADAPVQRPADLPPAARDAVRAWLDQRLVEAREVSDSAPLAQRQESLERARSLQAAGIEAALPLGVRDALSANVTAALDLLEAGTCGAVLLDSGEHWDTHAHQERQHEAHQGLFAGLGRLVGGLVARGMVDVKVLVVAEMARSPTRNADGGTEHWPTTSALWIDPARTEGGRVLGGTSDALVALPVDLSTGALDPSGVVPRYDHLARAVLEACGANAEAWLPGVAPYAAISG